MERKFSFIMDQNIEAACPQISIEQLRENLQNTLYQYITDTFRYIYTVKGFCERFSTWKDTREAEVTKIKNIKDIADNTDLSFSRVTQSEHKFKAFSEYIKRKVTADRRREELEKELDAVLEDTLRGLVKLHRFLDAVEKLAVTSLYVFTEENQVLHLPEEISPKKVQVVIIAARLICPLLLEFKRDPKVFFLPKLQNVEVLAYQLKKYIQTTEEICDIFRECSFSDISLYMNGDIMVDLSVDFYEDNVQNMLCHINQLHEIRMDQDFRMVFLFQEDSCSDFINKFNECRPRMLQFLSELEKRAVQLDKMNKGAKISSVAGSSVGAVGGVLSIVGLTLIPVTAGVSLALTMTGVGLAITSGVNSVVTTATEVGVNTTQKKKADELFKSFMDDVKSVQDCLEEATCQKVTKVEAKPKFLGYGKMAAKGTGIGMDIFRFVQDASDVNLLTSKELILGAGKVTVPEAKALCNVPRVAADIPDVGQAAVKGSLALSKSARVFFIAVNALFLGIDIAFICKDSVSLAKGSETEVSQFIRARSALWSSEIDSWQKIHDSLSEGLQTSEKQKSVLETPFYPEMEVKKQMGMEENEIVLETPLCSKRENYDHIISSMKVGLRCVIAVTAFVAIRWHFKR